MNPVKYLLIKIRMLRAKRIAKKYGECYAAAVEAFLTALQKTLVKTDPVKVQAARIAAENIITYSRNFWLTHGGFIKEFGKTLAAEFKSDKVEKKMSEIDNVIKSVFEIR